jgi:hypothetical protein
MCQAVRPLIGETHFQTQGNPCGVCADKVALAQVFSPSESFGLPLSVFFLPCYMPSLLIIESDYVVEFSVLKMIFSVFFLSSHNGVLFKVVF